MRPRFVWTIDVFWSEELISECFLIWPSQVSSLFQKLLIGIYRVRVELSAFSKESGIGTHGKMPIPLAVDANSGKVGDDANDGDNDEDDSDGDDNTLC